MDLLKFFEMSFIRIFGNSQELKHSEDYISKKCDKSTKDWISQNSLKEKSIIRVHPPIQHRISHDLSIYELPQTLSNKRKVSKGHCFLVWVIISIMITSCIQKQALYLYYGTDYVEYFAHILYLMKTRSSWHLYPCIQYSAHTHTVLKYSLDYFTFMNYFFHKWTLKIH